MLQVFCHTQSLSVSLPHTRTHTTWNKFLWCDDPPLHSLAAPSSLLPRAAKGAVERVHTALDAIVAWKEREREGGERCDFSDYLHVCTCFLSPPPIPSHTLWTYLYTSKLVTCTTRLAWTVNHVHKVQTLWSNTIPVHTPCDFQTTHTFMHGFC